jgi:diadenosine tetraphosphate (Ap4A) HIT family hydrolase
MALVSKGVNVLYKMGHGDCTILCRDGKALGKSISHVHYNIIPGGFFTDTSVDSTKRDVLDESEQRNIETELKEIISKTDL